MHIKRTIILTLASTAAAQVQKGFNYGATFETGGCRAYQDFVNLFNTAKGLPGAAGFSSARLYTMVQCGTPNDPISAIQAAIDTDTTLMLGMWASAGDENFAQEVTALQRAFDQYGSAFTDRIIGLSVGSEDLYRSSPQGQANNAGVGATGPTIEGYISWVRDVFAGTPIVDKPIGHVDTWTAWILPENRGVADSVNFLGHNSFPYFENTRPNPIEEASNNFWSAVGNTEIVAGGKPVWITETGWPHSGPTQGQAVASVDNARTYYSTVGCELFGNRNTWWYTLEDANTAQTEISFGLVAAGGGAPIYDLSCPVTTPDGDDNGQGDTTTETSNQGGSESIDEATNDRLRDTLQRLAAAFDRP